MNCPYCGVPLMGGMYVCPKCKYDTREKDGGEYFKNYKDIKKQEEEKKLQALRAQEEEDIRMGKLDAIRDRLRREMFMTTCPSLEGYRIVKQCGIVFGEVAFKTGFFKSLSATIDNVVDIFSFGDKELSGTARLLKNARDYALMKLKDEAINREANAIVGVDSESTVGGDILHITITGTAVVVEKQ